MNLLVFISSSRKWMLDWEPDKNGRPEGDSNPRPFPEVSPLCQPNKTTVEVSWYV